MAVYRRPSFPYRFEHKLLNLFLQYHRNGLFLNRSRLLKIHGIQPRITSSDNPNSSNVIFSILVFLFYLTNSRRIKKSVRFHAPLFSSIICNGNTGQRYKQKSIGSIPRRCFLSSQVQSYKKGDIPLHIALYSMPIPTLY